MARGKRQYGAVVLGVSLGGVEALGLLLGDLPGDFPLPLLVVHHISPDAGSDMAQLLGRHCVLQVKEADEEELAVPGTVYLAPANYHLLVERDGRLALSVDPPVNFARPSVDVLFDSAADAFGAALIGIVLTGAGSDGSRGLAKIKGMGGVAIIQDPADAAADSMPRSALAAVRADYVLPLSEIAALLCRLASGGRSSTKESRQTARGQWL